MQPISTRFMANRSSIHAAEVRRYSAQSACFRASDNRPMQWTGLNILVERRSFLPFKSREMQLVYPYGLNRAAGNDIRPRGGAHCPTDRRPLSGMNPHGRSNGPRHTHTQGSA